MPLTGKLKPMVAAAVVLVAAAAGLYYWSRPPVRTEPLVRVVVPELTELGRRGEKAFEAYCAECHGRNAAGSDRGPPLVHQIYRPNHHADIAFARAARFGVRQHHWFFGDMPPRPEVSDEDIVAIVRYVRELQRANGIR